MQQRLSELRSFPLLGRLGAAVMLAGLVVDLATHTLTEHAHEPAIAGFPASESIAHLIVFLGMALVLTAVVVDGIRIPTRQAVDERSHSRAVR